MYASQSGQWIQGLVYTASPQPDLVVWGEGLFLVGGPRAMHAKCAVARGVWGHASLGNVFNFRGSEIDSGAFWDTFSTQVFKL